VLLQKLLIVFTILKQLEIHFYFLQYREFKEKINISDHKEDDTVSFNPRDTWFFNRKESEGLTGDEMLTIPHPILMVRTTQQSHTYDVLTSELNHISIAVMNFIYSTFV
jgi:hypothetical protein